MVKLIVYLIEMIIVIVTVIIVTAVTRKNKKLSKVSEIIYELLPNFNCKDCGRENCVKFADDLARGRATIKMCPHLLARNHLKIRQILKQERKVHFDYIAVVRCKGGCDCNTKFEYIGDHSCASLDKLHSGNKACPFACLGCGDCINSCKYGAISISKKGCAVVDRDRCVGCGECTGTCPNKLIELKPSRKYVEVICNNKSDDADITRNCKVSCTHCEACVMACPSDAIAMVGGMPIIDETKCIRCGKCVAVCPQHTISRI